MTRAIASLLLLCAACGDQQVNLGGNYVLSALIPPIENKDIDILFVVDNSPSMYANLVQVADKAKEALFDVIDAAVDDAPNLHVGAITSNMGTMGVVTDPNCIAGDDGRLVIGDPDVADDCAQIVGDFISDVEGVTNYTGTLEEAFGCLVQVGAGGCGFEHHLAALERSLVNPLNDGFLRPEAILVAIVLADEDDCSAYNADFFGPESPALGHLDSYRCFRHGMVCNEPLDVPGDKTGCVPDDASAYIKPLGPIADALVTAKGGDATKVLVATIAGPPEPIAVGEYMPTGQTEPWLDLAETCVSTVPMGGIADPAIRLQTFLDYFPGRSWFESICDPVEMSLRNTGNMVGDIAGRRPCLRGDLRDVDADTAGLQPSCRVFLVDSPSTPAEVRTEVVACDGETTTACFTITADAATCEHANGLRVDISGSTPTQHLLVECLEPEAP
jgi:hypothetical protein